MQYHAIQCNTMQYNAITCNTMQYHAIPCNTVQYYVIPCNIMQYYAIPCNTMQYPASLITDDGAYHCPVGSIMAIFLFISSQLTITMGYVISPFVMSRMNTRPQFIAALLISAGAQVFPVFLDVTVLSHMS